MLALTKHTMNQKILASGFWAKYKENMKTFIKKNNDSNDRKNQVVPTQKLLSFCH